VRRFCDTGVLVRVIYLNGLGRLTNNAKDIYEIAAVISVRVATPTDSTDSATSSLSGERSRE
jgi:hypothetical protein